MSKRRILVVDDEQNARQALRTLLVEEGYEVAEAADGAEALGLIGAETYPKFRLDGPTWQRPGVCWRSSAVEL